MMHVPRLRKLGASLMYIPGFSMILLGVAVLLYPKALPWAAAAFFVLAGTVLTQVVWTLRRFVRRLRTQIEFSAEEIVEGAQEDEEPTSRTQAYWVN